MGRAFDSNSRQLAKAKAYAFLLLKFCPRSEKEMGERLKKKKFSEEITRQALAFLKEKRFIDDAAFARDWLESRLRKPLGVRKIVGELRLKGISGEIIEDTVSSLPGDYSEAQVIADIIRGKSKTVESLDRDKATRRLYGYLVRRGFSPETVKEALCEHNLS